jgi:hypothetical protein
MSEHYNEINDDFLSFSPPTVSWHQITSLNIAQPFNSTHLYLLFSRMTNLRTLGLHYRPGYDNKVTLLSVVNTTVYRIQTLVLFERKFRKRYTFHMVIIK